MRQERLEYAPLALTNYYRLCRMRLQCDAAYVLFAYAPHPPNEESQNFLGFLLTYTSGQKSNPKLIFCTYLKRKKQSILAHA
jgi:hypothetical protein